MNINLDEKICDKILTSDKNFSYRKYGLLQKALYGLKQNRKHLDNKIYVQTPVNDKNFNFKKFELL